MASPTSAPPTRIDRTSPPLQVTRTSVCCSSRPSWTTRPMAWFPDGLHRLAVRGIGVGLLPPFIHAWHVSAVVAQHVAPLAVEVDQLPLRRGQRQRHRRQLEQVAELPLAGLQGLGRPPSLGDVAQHRHEARHLACLALEGGRQRHLGGEGLAAMAQVLPQKTLRLTAHGPSDVGVGQVFRAPAPGLQHGRQGTGVGAQQLHMRHVEHPLGRRVAFDDAAGLHQQDCIVGVLDHGLALPERLQGLMVSLQRLHGAVAQKQPGRCGPPLPHRSVPRPSSCAGPRDGKSPPATKPGGRC